jgi:excisionase family DNA binding protein
MSLNRFRLVLDQKTRIEFIKWKLMKIEIDDNQLIDAIADKVIASLTPLLNQNAKKMDIDNILFTVESLAKYLQVSKPWVYERVHLNEIPYMKMGKFPRFRRSEIDKWLGKMQTPAIQPLSNKLKMIK